MYSFKSVIFHSTLLYFIVRKKSYSHPVKGTVIKHREPWLMAYRFPFCIFLWASPPVDLSASDALPNSTFSTHGQPSLLLAANSSRELPLADKPNTTNKKESSGVPSTIIDNENILLPHWAWDTLLSCRNTKVWVDGTDKRDKTTEAPGSGKFFFCLCKSKTLVSPTKSVPPYQTPYWETARPWLGETLPPTQAVESGTNGYPTDTS